MQGRSLPLARSARTCALLAYPTRVKVLTVRSQSPAKGPSWARCFLFAIVETNRLPIQLYRAAHGDFSRDRSAQPPGRPAPLYVQIADREPTAEQMAAHGRFFPVIPTI